MSSNQWSGQFNCTGKCQRKRLIAEEFSKKALENFRKSSKPLRCKKCVEESAEMERKQADKVDSRSTTQSVVPSSNEEQFTCSLCSTVFPRESFNRNQLNKGPEKQRCKACVEKTVAEELQSTAGCRTARLKEAKERLRKAETSGAAAEKLAAASELAALEAEIVTGLKPKVLGKGRGKR